MKLRLAVAGRRHRHRPPPRPVVRPRRRRPSRHRRPDPAPRHRDQRAGGAPTCPCSPTSPARSAIPRSATVAPSAARSPTATRPRIFRRPAWRWGLVQGRRPGRGADHRRRRLLPGLPGDGPVRRRDPDRDRRPEGRPAPDGRSRSSTAGLRTGPSSGSPPSATAAPGIGLVNMGSIPLRATAVEEALAAGASDAEAASHASDGLDPPADLNASTGVPPPPGRGARAPGAGGGGRVLKREPGNAGAHPPAVAAPWATVPRSVP